jgi:hypothetical protein
VACMPGHTEAPEASSPQRGAGWLSSIVGVPASFVDVFVCYRLEDEAAPLSLRRLLAFFSPTPVVSRGVLFFAVVECAIRCGGE